jgi:hypothetical protein
MKYLIILIAFSTQYSYGQISASNLKIDSLSAKKDTLYTASGFKFFKGQMIKIGAGSSPDGYFKFIRKSDLVPFMGQPIASTSAVKVNYVDDKFNTLPPKYSGKYFAVCGFEAIGNKRSGFTYLPLIRESFNGLLSKLSGPYYQIDTENAVNNDEINYAGFNKTKKGVNPVVEVKIIQDKQQLSLADELSKLKKLLDDGTLNKEEYEALKKKIISN